MGIFNARLAHRTTNRIMLLTKDEFYAYMLAYAIQADFKISPGEREFILSRIPEDLFRKVNGILDKDSDYEAVQRIMANATEHYGEQHNADTIISDIQGAMKSDGEMDAAEIAAFVGLRRLLRSGAEG